MRCSASEHCSRPATDIKGGTVPFSGTHRGTDAKGDSPRPAPTLLDQPDLRLGDDLPEDLAEAAFVLGRVAAAARASAGVVGRAAQPGKPVEELEREYGIRNAIKLASNENPFGPSPLAVAAARAVIPNMARYPEASEFEKSFICFRHQKF